MKKMNLWPAGIGGIFIGLFGSIFFSYISRPDYSPLNPTSPVGQFFSNHQTHPALVLLYCMGIWFLLGLMFGLANRLYDKNWSILRSTLSHYGLTVIGFTILANLAGFFPADSLVALLVNILIQFTIVYFVIYAVLYLLTKNKIDNINHTIRKRQEG